MITYYIHGHGCSHNLIHGKRLLWSNPYYNYLSIVRASRLNKILHPHQIVYADHLFTNPDSVDYHQTCEDFQLDLPVEVYTPYTNLNAEECLRLHKSFDWRECPVQGLLDTNNYYYKTLYTSVSSIISFKDWCAMAVELGAYAPGEEYSMDPVTLEILPRPSRL